MDAAREVIARGVSDVFAAASAESLPNASIKSWCDAWLQAKSIEAEQSTHARYARIIERFIDCIGAKAKRDLSALQALDITRFRDREAKDLSRATANLSLKVLRVCFGEAVRQGLLAVNPAVRVPVLKTRDKSARRAFTPTTTSLAHVFVPHHSTRACARSMSANNIGRRARLFERHSARLSSRCD